MIHFSFQIVCLVVLRVCFAFVNMRTRESYSPDGVDFSHSSFKTFATHSYYSSVRFPLILTYMHVRCTAFHRANARPNPLHSAVKNSVSSCVLSKMCAL